MQALFDLAGRLEYVAPLREELEHVISEDGGARELSPRSLAKLVKMDSFLKESQRHISQNLRQSYLSSPPLCRSEKEEKEPPSCGLTIVRSIHIPQSNVSLDPKRRHHPPHRLIRMRAVDGPRSRSPNPNPRLQRLPVGEITAGDGQRHQISQRSYRVSSQPHHPPPQQSEQ